VFVVAWLAVFGPLLFWVSRMYGPEFSISGVAATFIVMVFTYEWIVFAGYRCPRCGTKLRRRIHRSGISFRYRYPCSSCDMIWETGLGLGGGADV
jgi:transposase-like protein